MTPLRQKLIDEIQQALFGLLPRLADQRGGDLPETIRRLARLKVYPQQRGGELIRGSLPLS